MAGRPRCRQRFRFQLRPRLGKGAGLPGGGVAWGWVGPFVLSEGRKRSGGRQPSPSLPRPAGAMSYIPGQPVTAVVVSIGGKTQPFGSAWEEPRLPTVAQRSPNGPSGGGGGREREREGTRCHLPGSLLGLSECRGPGMRIGLAWWHGVPTSRRHLGIPRNDSSFPDCRGPPGGTWGSPGMTAPLQTAGVGCL